MEKVKEESLDFLSSDFKIGQAEDEKAGTGVSVVIAPEGAVCGVDVRGGSPSTRDTDALNPLMNRKVVHAVFLAGGSSFGLDCGGGISTYLESHDIGRDVGVTKVPNVSGAILFDLLCGDSKVRPDAAMGIQACENAFNLEPFKNGNYGAGCGATVGKSKGVAYTMKSGIGSCLFTYGKLAVGAIAAVNAAGDVVENSKIIAGTLNRDKKSFAETESLLLSEYEGHKDLFSDSDNTILVCVVTNAILTKAEASKLAGFGQNGIARAIRPAHSVFDGDTVFTMCSSRVQASLDSVGILAAHSVEKAILTGVKSARSAYGFLAYRDVIS